MSRRREHGRIASVETMVRGGSLDADAPAGATSLLLVDAGDFDEDGGTLAIGMVLTGGEWDYSGAQLVEYVADDETGILTLTDPLTAAAERGDPVHLWDPLYDEAVEYQEALVELDGDEDNPEEVVAEVAEGVDTLPEGDRGRRGESCTIKRVSDDEWEVVGVAGRSRRSKGLRWEANDVYVLTAADITAGVATAPLSHQPDDEAVDARWRTTPQEPTEYTVNGDQTVTWPLSGFEAAGDRLWFHYTYRKGIVTAMATDDPPYDPTACSYVNPTTCTASIYVFNTSNWKSRITINGTWKGGGPLTTLAARIVYRDAADPEGTIKYSAELQLDGSTINTMMEGGYYGGNKTGAHIYGVHLGPTATWSALTPQNGGTLGTTDPTQCRFWWGEQIAVTDDRSNEPMGDINGNLADWWSLL